MPKYIDETGRRYGMLVVVRPDIAKRKNGHRLGMYWHVKCDCGNEKSVRGQNLRSGHQLSCGCRNWYRLPLKESALRTLFSLMRGQASRRGIEWNLTRDNVGELIFSACSYCGEGPGQLLKRNRGITYNGIDRLNSSLGYTPENVVTCCKHCNFAKNSMSYNEFRDWIERVHTYLTATGEEVLA